MIKKLLLLLVVSLFSLPTSGDSLYEKSHGKSFFKHDPLYKVGDILTVQISAESTAVQEAGTTTRKSTDIGANFYNLYDKYSIDSTNDQSLRSMQDYRLGGKDDYTGVGQTTREK